jgi:hypothetical protein
MAEAQAQVETERDSEADLPTVMSDDPSNAHAALSEDKLLTKRLPPMTPPPMRPETIPPADPRQNGASFGPVSGTISGTFRGDRVDTSFPPQPRTSWWKALLTETQPPPSNTIPPPAVDERVFRRRIGATCAGMAIGFVILALALGLRGAEPAFSPMVAAAMVIARAIIAVGFLAFGYGLLRMAERFFAPRSTEAPPSSGHLH